MSDKNSAYTLNDKPALVLSGLLGKFDPKTRTVETKKGPGVKTEFSIRVDLERGADGTYSKEARYISVSIFGDYAEQLKAFRDANDYPRVAVSGYYNARPEQVKPDGGVWPARLDFNAQHIYLGATEAPAATEKGGW
jgi:hypothetical protein